MEDAQERFSQEALDNIIRDRLQRQKETLEARHAETLSEHTTRIGELEAQIANAQGEHPDRVSELETQLAEQTQRVQDVTIEAAIKAGAVERRFHKVDDALKLVDRERLSVTEDGTVTGLEEVLDGLVYKYPEIVRRQRLGSADQGARGQQKPYLLTRVDLKDMSTEEILAAHRQGRIQGHGGDR
jgi:hypothetical protein